ncbi:hypothetical protein BV25DRAFT_1843360 [Artomyces pyxidatus]|uniref:Uncharacterized protein n=1 Tax=Artomyces pyxidatus TaxID=48021 RepID=A0ACB8SGF0_9AGAM|nr:hypothetical protein BV25DRAFT_1843360 [Artomyces pyxidatus]
MPPTLDGVNASFAYDDTASLSLILASFVLNTLHDMCPHHSIRRSSMTLETADGGYTCPLDLIVTPDLPVDVVLGHDWSCAARVFIASGSIQCPPPLADLGHCLPSSTSPSSSSHAHAGIAQTDGFVPSLTFSRAQHLLRLFLFTSDALALQRHLALHGVSDVQGPPSVLQATLAQHLFSGQCCISHTSDIPPACTAMSSLYTSRPPLVSAVFEFVLDSTRESMRDALRLKKFLLLSSSRVNDLSGCTSAAAACTRDALSRHFTSGDCTIANLSVSDDTATSKA